MTSTKIQDENQIVEYSTITVERRDRVAIITLNRPEALNALNGELMDEVVTAALDLDADSDIGAIVLTQQRAVLVEERLLELPGEPPDRRRGDGHSDPG